MDELLYDALPGAGARRPAVVVAAAALSALYSLGLVWFAGAAAAVLLSGRANGDVLAALGMVSTALLGLAGAGLLLGGGVRVWRGRYLWTRIVLTLVLGVSVIGNTADFMGGTVSTASHVIGVSITIAAIVPLLLLRTSSARDYAAARLAGGWAR